MAMASMIRICTILCLLGIPSALALGGPLTDGSKKPGELPSCQNTQEHIAKVDGVRVHYLEAGAGQTIVLIHGNAGSVNDFSYRVIDLLCGEYKVIAVDRPGHGKSDRLTRESARLESQAALLHDTLRSLGITRPILVGHSWGASLALAYALQYQDDTSSMILLAPAAYAEKAQNGWWMTAFIKPPVIGDMSLAVGKLFYCRHMLKRELEHAFYPQPVPDDYFKAANASWLDRKHIRSYLEDESKLNASLESLSSRYSEIHVPVIIVTGDSDKIVSPHENAYRLKAAISQSQLMELKHTGHEIPQTDPQSIRDALALISSSTANRMVP
jgi:pimeloyl-ACP methyl ester carboxylesterase